MFDTEELIRKIFTELFDQNVDTQTLSTFQTLIGFIDEALAASYGLNGDERAIFMMQNLLKIRDFLNSELLTEKSRLLLLNSADKKIVKLFKKEEEEVVLEQGEDASEKKQDTHPQEDI